MNPDKQIDICHDSDKNTPHLKLQAYSPPVLAEAIEVKVE
jgi:hypothetical protein